MTPLIHCSIGNINLFPETNSFIQTKRVQCTKYNTSLNHAKWVLYARDCDFPLHSLRLSRLFRISLATTVKFRSQTIAATGTDPPGEGEDEGEGISPSPSNHAIVLPTSSVKHPKPVKKSEMPPVNDEELIPGASFIGKVRSIQPFGAFVDIGAFTDGLVHISRLSTGYVKDVTSIVSIGQEVRVKIVEANKETGRISLTMHDGGRNLNTQHRKEKSEGRSSDKPGSLSTNAATSSQMQDEEQKSAKLERGQILVGKVKNIMSLGSYVSLPNGEEGFLPVSEEPEVFLNILSETTLRVGQEVKVRVLHISNGKITLTMEMEGNVESLFMEINPGEVHAATNPFELAFRQNKNFAAFLDKRDNARKKTSLVEDKANESEMVNKGVKEGGLSDVPASEDTFELPATDVNANADRKVIKTEELPLEKGFPGRASSSTAATAKGRIGSYIHCGRIGVLIEVNCETDSVSHGEIFRQLVDDLSMQVAACPQVHCVSPEDVPEEVVSRERGIEMQKEDLMRKPEQIRDKIIDGRVNKRLAEFALLEQPYIKNDKLLVKYLIKQTIAAVGENIQVKRFARYNLGEGLEKDAHNLAAQVSAQIRVKISPSPPKDQPVEGKEAAEKWPSAAIISVALVKRLREETGAGMMDCKTALSETGGDFKRAKDYLCIKGLSFADKKSSRVTTEGRIASFIHHNLHFGCLIEVNCETDFVGRSERFIGLVDDLAMQIAACPPQVEYVSVEDIPETIVGEMKKMERIAGMSGRRPEELALLEQPFIKNGSLLVKDLLRQTIAALGENIRVRRFVRYRLGEILD